MTTIKDNFDYFNSPEIKDPFNCNPLDYRILAVSQSSPEKTKSGLYIPESARDSDAAKSTVLRIIKMGENAFKDSKGESIPSSPEVGDYITCRKYAGSTLGIIKSENGTIYIFWLITDAEVIATLGKESSLVNNN